MNETTYKIGFYTYLVAYVGFWLVDGLRPGFVARYVSVHIFLLVTLVFAFLWMSKRPN